MAPDAQPEANGRASRPGGKTILILSQVYPPDPASVGQHMADVATELARRGHRVRVITSSRGYEDASVKYPPRETRDGVEIRRVPLSSFGKKSFVLRAVAMGFFILQCLWAGLTTGVGRGGLHGLLVSTSPPMCGVAAGVVRMLRGTPVTYWVMDLNPDQLIELGTISEKHPVARLLNAMQRFVLKRATHVVALDRFMAERLNKKRDVADKMTIMPPWPHEDVLGVVPHDENWFRERHELDGKFVFMYSGNHTPSNPIRTVLDAALRLQDDDRIRFMFIGGGLGKREVDETIERERPSNVVSLPYQPFEDLRYSLSAADVHIVTVGDTVVGVVHPCKIYGAMAVARPILLCAPDPCHASDVIAQRDVGWHIRHGDVDGAVATCREIVDTEADRLTQMGQDAQDFIASDLSKGRLCGRFCDIIEGTLR